MAARLAAMLLALAGAFTAGAAGSDGKRWFGIAAVVAGVIALEGQRRRQIQRSAQRIEWLDAILDAVPHPLFYKDVDSRYLGGNKAFQAAFGKSFGDVAGRTDAELFGQPLHDRFVAQDRELLETGEGRVFHEEMQVGGETRQIESRKAPFRDASGKLLGIVGLATDITEHRRLRQQLEVSNARLTVALRAAQMGTWLWDSETDEMDLDAFERQLFGLSQGPGRAGILAERAHPDDQKAVRWAVKRALQEGVAVDYEFRWLSDQGEWRWFEGSAMRYAERPTCLVGINRDITQRKQQAFELAEAKRHTERVLAELEQSRIDLDMALRSGKLGVWRSEFRDIGEADTGDDPGLDDPIEWDANVRRIYGLDLDEPATRRHFFDALHPQDRDRVLARIGEAGQRGSDYSDRFRIIRRDGQVAWIAVDATVVTRADTVSGGHRWMTGIARDITEEETLKEDLRQKAHEAQMAVEAKARFLAMMSHEIRTPLNGVVGMIELLTETPLSAEQQHMLKTCKDSAFVLLTVINDILDFSKIEAGKLELDLAPLSPRRLVEGVGEALGVHASQRGIDLDVFVAPEVPRRIVGDRVRLRQILTNLVGNAIKFTQRGGVLVTVSVEPHAGQGDGVRLRFDVHDSGIGMDPEVARTLFQPFQQADAATTRRFGGTGLGLSIVKHLAELMDGTVECESWPMRGSRFSVVIPFALATSSERDWGYSIAGVRVHALMKNPWRRRILGDYLSQFEAGVEFFDDPERLFDHARHAHGADRPDVVVLDRDWSVSERAGTRRRFSETPELASLPFVVVRSSEAVQSELIPDAVLVYGNPLTRGNVIQGIAVALGRASPVVPAVVAEAIDRPAQEVSHDEEESSGRLILLAEDNPTNREVIAHQLQRLGYACDIADDGQQAWEMLQAGRARYALLLTDCHMPRLDGYQLTQRIRDDERERGAPQLPIIAITANALRGEGERCMALGMDGYLPKPLQLRELRRTLQEFLPPAPAGTSASVPAAVRGIRFPALEEVLGGDAARVRRVLEAFERSTQADGRELDAARMAGDWQRVRYLAHKLKSGCRQLGEEATAQALETVEHGAGHDEMSSAELDRAFAGARDGLQQLLARVGGYLLEGEDR
jgi:PAS domain S-box-containing protein